MKLSNWHWKVTVSPNWKAYVEDKLSYPLACCIHTRIIYSAGFFK